MKYLILSVLFVPIFLTSCQGNEDKNKNKSEEEIVNPEFKEEDNSNLTIEERAKKQAIAKIGMPANEDFSIQVYPAYLNNDNIADALVTINRLSMAKENAARSRDAKILEKNGYVGNYNYIMIYDGGNNQFSVPVPIPSSAAKELDVDFVNLFSDEYVTAVVSYRIKNTEFKNFYSVNDGIMDKVFKMVSYDKAGEKDVKGFIYEIQEKGHFSAVKDIITYKATLENSSEIGKDWFNTKPILKKIDEVDKNWFYDPKQASYVTPDR